MPAAIFSVFIIAESLGGKAGEGKISYVRKLFAGFCASSGGWRAILLCFSPNTLLQRRQTPGAFTAKRGYNIHPPSQICCVGKCTASTAVLEVAPPKAHGMDGCL